MKIRIELLSDAIFGSGISVPGAEDSSVVHDRFGFPYMKGSTFRGILKEELINYLVWTEDEAAEKTVESLFGKSGFEKESDDAKRRRINVSDFCLSEVVRNQIIRSECDYASVSPNMRNEQMLSAISGNILESLTNIRTFTAIEDGIVKDSSLRMIRCINKGLVFYGEIECDESDKQLLSEVLPFIKWIGNKKTRGFGKVKITNI